MTLYVTGAGQVRPVVATGDAPAAGTPVDQLPLPVFVPAVTVGGQPASITFDGVPPGLVGVVQINFVVPANVPVGPQPLVVTMGGQRSAAATFMVVQ